MERRLALPAALLLVVVGIVSGCGGAGPTSAKHGNPMAILEDEARLMADPAGTLLELRSLGVQIVRVDVPWASIAPDPGSSRQPRGFDASDPAAYPRTKWARYDAIVRDAHRYGLKLDFLLTSPVPTWAAGPGAPPSVPLGVWKPSAPAYGEFVRAVATRYSGAYTPAGAAAPLPRVSFWEIWDEPNWGPALAPQFSVGSTAVVSAPEYRDLLDAAWAALQQTGHGQDTILIGNLSPRGLAVAPESVFAASLQASSPLSFTQGLYCVGSSSKPLAGTAARQAGCPPKGDPRRFRVAHPALFEASGYGVHPYPVNLPPTESDSTDPGTVEFSQIPHLIRALDQVQRMYGSDKRMAVYNTEYGYITHPPNAGTQYVSPAVAARYLNWTEYLTWRDPRIATISQYGLVDSKPAQTVYGFGGFATGLFFYGGQPKQTFYAYRMPVFLPTARAKRGQALEVWGCARPAPYAYLDTHQPQYVQIQFRAGMNGRFQTIRTVRLDAARGCYFDVHVNFPTSGTVRISWSYPPHDSRLYNTLSRAQDAIYSRDVEVKVG